VNLAEPFVRRPVMTVVLTLSAILFGILAYRQMPVDALPPVDYPVITVNVGYPGASPETMANNIATPLERQFMQISGLEVITSKSTQGNVALTLQFSLDKSGDVAATDVQAAISRATGNLPNDLPAPPTFEKTNPNDQPILYVGITSDTMTRGQLYDMANTQLAQRVSILGGVSQVQIYGTKSAIRIKADPSALAARQLTMDDLADAIRRGTSYQGAGQFDGPDRTFLIQPQGQLDTAEAYNNLIIQTRDGAPIYLRDVAVAAETVEDERVDMRFWLRGRSVPKATVVMAVFRQAGSNAVEVASNVRALLPEVKNQLPASVNIVPIYDRSKSIVNSVKDVTETLVIAFVLVVVVIFIFLGRAGDTLIPIVALPLSLLLTFIVMRMLDYTIDNLSLMALTLAIGFLIDDAIVFLENTVRRMEKFGEDALTATLNSAKEISFTILSMTVSLAVVFLPLVFMSGIIGRVFQSFAVTIIIAILASGIVSLTLTPLMCARMLGKRGHDQKKTLMERAFQAVERPVLAFYSSSLWFFLRHKWVSLIIFVLCLGGTGYLLVTIPNSFLPVGDSSFSLGVLIGQQGSSPEKMRDFQSKAEAVMQANESVNMTFTMTGNGQFIPSNMGFLIAFLKDKADRPPLQTIDGRNVENPSIQEVSGDIGARLAMGLPGAIGVLNPQPVLQISTGATNTQGGQFAYSISGVNPQEVYGAAGALIGKLIPHIGTTFLGFPISDMYLDTPSLAVDIHREKAELYGVSASRIENLLRNAYSQNYVYLIKRPDDQYQVILEVAPEARSRPEDLGKLYVRSDDGSKLVPLTAVASWREGTGPQQVNHLNQFTSVTINFNLMPGVAVGEATKLVEQLSKEVVSPQLRSSFQGEALTFQETRDSLLILMVLAVFVMYVILAILYESYVHPITVLSTLPTALVGGLATLVLFGEDASLYAFIGLFMLMGIVKKNGIMIVDFAIQRIAGGMTADKAIHEASMDRFRPILMTTLAAVMGAVPIALGHGADGEGRRPLGLVIVGGLLVSQLITLYVTPVLYLYMELFQERVLDRVPFLRSGRTHTGDRFDSTTDATNGHSNGKGELVMAH
jgi:HAE1 family hydrophobic/amphiphilic exporter-1